MSNDTDSTDGGIDATDSDDSGIDATDPDDSGIGATDPDDATAPDRGRASARGRARGTWATADLRERLQWVALIVLAVVAVATLFAFYTNVSRLISIWATRRYEPAIQAAFSLSMLASALAGIAWLSRNLE